MGKQKVEKDILGYPGAIHYVKLHSSMNVGYGMQCAWVTEDEKKKAKQIISILLRAFSILPMVPLEILPKVPLVANGSTRYHW